MSRLVVVSNRVAPIEEGQPTAGGLAAGVMDALRQHGGIWFGWSGDVRQEEVPPNPARTSGPITLFTTDLSQRDYDDYYRGFSNGTLWPVLHYQTSLMRFDWGEFAGYRRVNALFARCLMQLIKPDDMIWAHDFHLLGLADALRTAGAENRMGLFMHTPFPAPSVFSTIPAHAELIRAMCQYDLVGFQTESDRHAFTDYLTRQSGGQMLENGAVSCFGRVVRTGVYPIGIDVTEVRAQAEAERNQTEAQSLRAGLLGKSLIMSVERLDYSKGLRQRFGAYERFLAHHAEWRRKVIYLQVAPPSRTDIEAYRAIRKELEGEAGRINGRFAELDWVPLFYLNRSFARPALMPLYASARVGLVTPLRDGMNLVAKEYAAAQDPEDPGVLVLSQFAGAAREMETALLVNPYDEQGMAQALAQALAMPLEERKERHAAMIAVMREHSLERWRDRFEADLRAH
ncbi:alpha,alpha-trehalose-phosphate synthase (UDP-forming) [Acetobacteraceae bacterium H6797]|nr:alpha,alpha-trehalose-phosphate synthase (UDP-forming) [Acetobacteraceae bacterium H6797]